VSANKISTINLAHAHFAHPKTHHDAGRHVLDGLHERDNGRVAQGKVEVWNPPRHVESEDEDNLQDGEDGANEAAEAADRDGAPRYPSTARSRSSGSACSPPRPPRRARSAAAAALRIAPEMKRACNSISLLSAKPRLGSIEVISGHTLPASRRATTKARNESPSTGDVELHTV
jgi:hypothetical protein